MYSNKLQKIMDSTQRQAYEQSLSTYSLEMLINEILKDQEVVSFFETQNISAMNIQQDFESAVALSVADMARDSKEPTPDDFVVNIFSRASLDLKKSNSKGISEICVYNILASTMLSDKTEAYEILASWNVTRAMFSDKLNKEVENNSEEDNYTSYDPQEEHSAQEEGETKDESGTSFLINLNERAKQGKLNPMIGRENEVHMISTILARKTKCNPVITGEPGVGKTAIVEGLAHKIVNGEAVEELKDKEIYSLNIGALMSGTKYRGDFEKRIVKIIKDMKRPNAIVFIDEIHTILGAGSAGGSMDMANLLKPHLTSGELTIIGATTNDEYTEIFDKNGALSRRFNEVKVKELNPEETIVLLENIKDDFKAHHKVTYEDGVMNKIVSLTNRFVNEKHFPDKAIDFLDQLSAEVRLDKSREPIVSIQDTNKLMSKLTGVPLDSMENSETNKQIVDLSDSLKKKVFGQDEAIEKVSEAMMLSYAGLKPENAPIGSFLCVGPTGVGKTEMAKVLSERLSMPLVRFDMSEYMDQTSANKLLGAPNGYVGYDEGGLLRKTLRDKPYAVVLFDEFEKAHSSMYNLFLQILDEGEVKDSQGRMIDFKNTIVLFTSNAGVVKGGNEGRGIGFGADHNGGTGLDMSAIKTEFPPEFRNRLSNVLEFNKLSKESVYSISDRLMGEMVEQLEKNKGVVVKYTQEVSEFVGDEGFDPAMGARPIKRKIVDLISKELAKVILLNSLSEGDKVSITMNKTKDTVLFRKTKAKNN